MKNNPRELKEVKTMKRNDIVPFYRNLILVDMPKKDKEVKRINRLILSKWTMSGLEYIKNKAWHGLPFN